jgi:hypothetical protein
MKTSRWIFPILVSAAVLGISPGCKKSDVKPEPMMANGVPVEMSKLQFAFKDTTSEEVRKLVNDAALGFRYQQYVNSLMALDQLLNQPGLTPEQKKLVEQVIDQEKRVAGGAPGQ